MSEKNVVKVAVVIAGGSGMGAAAARKLREDGFEVAILSSSGKGEALAAELGGLGVTGSNQNVADIQTLVDAVGCSSSTRAPSGQPAPGSSASSAA